MIGDRAAIDEKWANWIPAKTATLVDDRELSRVSQYAHSIRSVCVNFANFLLRNANAQHIRVLDFSARSNSSRVSFLQRKKKASRALGNTPNATCTHLHSVDADGAQKCTSVNTNINATVYGIRNPTSIIPRSRTRAGKKTRRSCKKFWDN